MSTNLFVRIFVLVNDTLNNYITTASTSAINFATPIITSMLLVWIVMWGYLLMFGKISEPVSDGVFRIIRIGTIFSLGLTIGTYNDVIVNFFQNGPEYIASQVTGNNGNIAQTLDLLFVKVFLIAESAWKQGGIYNGNFGCYLIALAVMVVGCGFVLFVSFLTLLSKIMTTVLLGLGPLFIVCLLFKPTQRIFEAWIGALSNYGILLILSSSIGFLVVSIAQIYVNSMAATDDALANMANLFDGAMLCIILGLCILVIKQLPQVAASLGGGFALATHGGVMSALAATRPSQIARRGRQIQNDLRTAGRPFSAGASLARRAYGSLKRNSVSSS